MYVNVCSSPDILKPTFEGISVHVPMTLGPLHTSNDEGETGAGSGSQLPRERSADGGRQRPTDPCRNA